MRMYIVGLLLVAAVLVAGCTTSGGSQNSSGGTGFSTGVYGNLLSAQQAASTVLDYIKPMLNQGVTVTLLDVAEESGLYKLSVQFSADNQVQNSTFYVTKDGRLLFEYAVDLTKPLPGRQQTGEFDAPDTEVPDLKFFVMSFCPAGQFAETALQPVYALLGSKAGFSPHYVIYDKAFVDRYYPGQEAQYCAEQNGTYYCSMHGIDELREDIRQICVFNKHGIGKFFEYVGHVNADCKLSDIATCWKTAAEKSGLNVPDIEACEASDGIGLIAEEKALNDMYGVSGSPAIVINDAEYQGERTPNDIKAAVCSGFKDAPAECSQSLDATAQQASGSCS